MRRYQKIPNLKLCFISALYKGEKFKDHDNPPQFEKIEGFDYFLFTNIDKNKLNTSWIIIEKDFPEYSDSIIKSRVPKFQAHTFPELQKYDYIVYMDAYYIPLAQKNRWIKTMQYMKENNITIIQQKNQYRDCAYEECDEIVRLKKDSLERAQKTKNFLKENCLPYKYGLWRNTFFMYKNNNHNLEKLFNTFWDIYKDNQLMHRDQPLYMLAIMKSGINPFEFRLDKILKSRRDRIGKHIYV